MDLDTVEREAEHDDKVAELELHQRNGRPYPETPPILLIVGEYSQAYRKNEQAFREKAQADIRKGVEWTSEKWATSKIASGVVGFKNVSVGDKAAQYSLDGVLQWFLRAPWHAKEAERAIRDHADFFVNGSSG